MELLDTLEARAGTVCVVGAGGKKTTLYALAKHAADGGSEAVVTATVRIPLFDPHVHEVVRTDDPAGAIEATTKWPLGVVPGRDGEDRYGGYPTEVVDAIADAAELVLVKADGARTREFKAPNDREPQLPASADVVLAIASVQAVGQPLTEAAVHRPERVSAIAGIEPGARIEPEHVAAVLASPAGGLKGVPDDATVIPLLNKADDERWASVGREIAAEIHARADVPKVVIASMVTDRIVDVV